MLKIDDVKSQSQTKQALKCRRAAKLLFKCSISLLCRFDLSIYLCVYLFTKLHVALDNGTCMLHRSVVDDDDDDDTAHECLISHMCSIRTNDCCRFFLSTFDKCNSSIHLFQWEKKQVCIQLIVQKWSIVVNACIVYTLEAKLVVQTWHVNAKALFFIFKEIIKQNGKI